MVHTGLLHAIPVNETLRLEKLNGYNILDSQPETAFNNIALRAAEHFNTPIALISLVDKYRVWYKSSVGLENITEVPRHDSLCSLVVLQEEVTLIYDALKEPCLLSNPFVASDFGLRFYAGAPIKTPDGFRIGAVCIIDKTPRPFTSDDQKTLEAFASEAMTEIKRRLCT